MASTHPAETIAGTVTSWLPDTTQYPYTSGCESVIFGTNFAVAWDPRAGVASIANKQCLPPVVTASYHQPAPSNGGTVYSLGPFVCPESFQSTLATTAGSTTHYVCCPPNFTCISGSPVTCTSLATPGQVLTLYPQSSDTFTLLTTTVSSTSIVGGVWLDAYLFGPMTASTSSSSSTSLSTSTTALVTPTTSMGAGNASQSASATASPSSSSDLTLGAKIGIGVAVPLAVIGIGALIAALFLRRKTKREALELNGRTSTQEVYAKLAASTQGLTPTHELSGVTETHELGGQERSELQGARYA